MDEGTLICDNFLMASAITTLCHFRRLEKFVFFFGTRLIGMFEALININTLMMML